MSRDDKFGKGVVKNITQPVYFQKVKCLKDERRAREEKTNF
jgi:hypothetical protein